MPIKKKTYIIILLFFIALALYFAINASVSGKHKTNCLNILKKSAQISVDSNHNTIVLSGSATTEDHQKILQLVEAQCQDLSIQNNIKIKSGLADSWLNFKIDHVNSKITILGIVNNQGDIDSILSSFSGSLPDMSIEYEIDLNNNAEDKNFAVTIMLILSAIDDIKLVDINLQKKDLIIKGLVRDKLREQQALMKLNQIFDDELNIINQLELVINNKPDIDKLEFEKAPLPKLEY
jgi:hypothetical protein